MYLLVFAGLFGCGAAWGQTNGSIRGIVNDPSGAMVPGATVTVTSERHGFDPHGNFTTKTAAFDIPELPVGTYDVQAEAQGFKKFVAKTRGGNHRPREFHHGHAPGRRHERHRNGRSQRGAGGNHQHAARRGDDGSPRSANFL